MELNNISVKDAFKQMQAKLTSGIGANGATLNKVAKDSEEGLFLYNALERIDPILHKPMSRFYWQDAMPIMYGGGAVEFASFFRINYNSYDVNKNVASGNGNIITTVKASIQKFQTMVKAYSWKLEIGWIDDMKYRQVGADILSQLDEGVRLYYNQKLDDVAFFGFVNEGAADAYGLFNNANITATQSTKQFLDPTTTATDIVDALNTLLAGITAGAEYNKIYQVNHLLLPPSIYTALVQPMVIGSGSTAIYTNVIDYFKANNYIKAIYGTDDLVILPNPYLETAGTGVTTDKRIVAYCYDEQVVRMPLPMDLTRGNTMFNPSSMAYETPFVTFIGSPQFVYITMLGYLDNI